MITLFRAQGWRACRLGESSGGVQSVGRLAGISQMAGLTAFGYARASTIFQPVHLLVLEVVVVVVYSSPPLLLTNATS